jgi:hypothetical protein
MQQVELIDGYEAPTIYIILNKKFTNKNTKYIKTKAWPKMSGYIFTNSIIDNHNLYKIRQGMRRYNGTLFIHCLLNKEDVDLPIHVQDYIQNNLQKIKNNVIKDCNAFSNPYIFRCNNYKFYKSKGERKCHEILSKNKKVKRIEEQYKFEACINIKPLPFDFKINLNEKDFFLLEYQGEQHFKSIKMWGGDEGYITRIKNDNIKKEFCKKNNIELLIISYKDYKNIYEIINNFISNTFKTDTQENQEHNNIKYEKQKVKDNQKKIEEKHISYLNIFEHISII